jgi:alkanesulfonate monooxygenase SsuD/methylene tetrahydromethanopterin reductase-like flavin-dependent oxidoreductase (luciferase family)
MAVDSISLINVQESSELHRQASGSLAPATNDKRYDRTEEFVAIMQRAWTQTSTSTTPSSTASGSCRWSARSSRTGPPPVLQDGRCRGRHDRR